MTGAGLRPLLYRRRLIPDETILLEDDKIISIDKSKIITKWDVLKPRSDFSQGRSCYYINEGYKISKFLKADGSLLYYYCDIIQTDCKESENSYLFTDLLFDLIVYEDGSHKVLDIEEGAAAIREKIISLEQMAYALEVLGKLLNIYYNGGFAKLAGVLDNIT